MIIQIILSIILGILIYLIIQIIKLPKPHPLKPHPHPPKPHPHPPKPHPHPPKPHPHPPKPHPHPPRPHPYPPKPFDCPKWCNEYNNAFKGDNKLFCTKQKKVLEIAGRKIHYALPDGEKPHPVILYLHGTGMKSWFPFCGSNNFNKFGMGELADTVKELIKMGYAVISVETAAGDNDNSVVDNLSVNRWQKNRSLGWDNPQNIEYSKCKNMNSVHCSDYKFFDALLKEINKSKHFNHNNISLMGFSSGGYLVSQLIESFPKINFKKGIVLSAGYYNCPNDGTYSDKCKIPKHMLKRYPPILFLHGANDKQISNCCVDPKVSEEFYEQLKKANIKTERYVEPNEGHRWISNAQDKITKWMAKNI